MKPTKSKDTKNQPKISTFLVPSNPFSNKSPSKQLKISSFFTKVNAKNSQEENICSNSGVKLLLSSPECIPGSPDQPKKRKRNDEPCKRKLFKLDNYNKLLYDPTDNDDCQIIESTPSEKQINHEPKEKIKNSSIVGRSHELKNVLVQQNPSHENNEQASFKSKSGAQSFSKFQTRTDKILSNVIKTTEDNIPPNKLSKLHVKTTNTHINSEEHKQKRGMSKQSNISNVDTKSNLNSKNIGKSDQSVHFKNKKNDKDQKMNTCSRKPSTCDKVTVQKPSILENDDLLDQLLGELDTNVRDKNLEQDKYDHTIKEKEYTDCSKQTVDNILIGNFGSKSPLVELNGNILSPNRNENAPKPTNREENSLEFKNVKNSLEENIDILCDQEVVNIGHPLVINESGKTTLNELPQRKNSSQKSEEAVQLSINADCEHNLQMPTPVKEAKCEEYTPIINVPRTPEKSEEVSSISQEVAAVLSATKSPILSSPSKKLIPDLSFISKINFDDDDEEWNFSQIDNLQKLDLTRFNKCEILNMETITGSQLKLCLKPCDSTENTTTWCLVMGSWVHTQLNVGDIINIKAEYSNEYQSWIVDNSRGLIVFQPDILVSGTSVVGALFCMRKSILSDLFKGVDSGSSIMVLGILLHEFLQEVLKGNLRTDSELRKVIESLISSQDTILMLYGSLMSLEDTKAELTSFIPRIQNFLATYVDSKKPPGKSTWDGRIVKVQDIEENIWLPNLGIKGKVDVTVKVRSRNVVKTLPLELKTGRASRSAEHRGQVILYAMMMSEMDQAVDSGLLLYLRENILEEVRSGHPEKRDLLMLRNQLVYYLKQDVKSVDVPYLPPPINHHSACSKCPYLYLCSAALREDGQDSLSDANPLKALSTQATEHLTEQHIRFVFHMTALVRMEFQAARHKSKQVSDVWTLDPEARESRGDCISNLSLDPGVESVKSRYACSLSRSYPIPSLVFSLSQYVIVSSSTQPAVASGFITALNENSLGLNLDRDLSALSAGGSKFHVDTYESQSLLSFNLIGLGLLLEKDHRNNTSLRSLIIDRTLPRFSSKHHASILVVGSDLFAKLNTGQKKAVLKVLTAKDYLLIKGMPGTGKSSTLACLIELLVRLKLSVLVTSHTHSAVDNLLIRLIDRVPFLRLGSVSRVHKSIVPYCDVICTKHCTSPEQLAEFYASKPVVGVTCMGSVHPLLTKRTFNVCIVDEATQVLLPAVLPPLLSAEKFVLVGDPEQLSPLVVSREASELGLSESLFSRLDRPVVTTCLTAQYRMNRFITQLVNRFTYQGRLECANEMVETATIPELNFNTDQVWLQKSLSHQLESSVIFLNVNCDNANEAANQNEANVIHTIVTALVQSGIPTDHIGVIATYRNQVSLLKRLLDKDIEINTVDQYQGRDKSIILYSSTCTSKSKESKILNDRKRLTVAISRAKHKLIILGDLQVIAQSHPVLNELVKYVGECGSVVDVPL